MDRDDGKVVRAFKWSKRVKKPDGTMYFSDKEVLQQCHGVATISTIKAISNVLIELIEIEESRLRP